MEAPAVLKINVCEDIKVADVVVRVQVEKAPYEAEFVWPEQPILSFIQPDTEVSDVTTLGWPPLMARAPSRVYHTVDNTATYIM